ncbi:ABC transporter substrate-binding protein [Ekhidna sp. To15]|uniref:ABC transporter substrate-binding protein n=1 Tax=Ekhidna sp. To15 TaxID=3395267 RepID=UPI003F51F394
MSDLRTVHDQMGREVTFSFPPRRIISLVPSQTEFLIDTGAPVVGRTKFCIHPANKVSKIPVIGGTKKFRFDSIRALNPDLIIGNKEENYQEGIDELANEFPVWMSDIYTLNDAFKMMTALGSICNKEELSNQIIRVCKNATKAVKGAKSGKVVYLIWKDPWMVAGKDTFIDHMLEHLGFENLVTEKRYPELTSEQIAELNPDTILFSSEPYPFTEEHLRQVQIQWPEASLELVDGELYSWYGSRLKEWM